MQTSLLVFLLLVLFIAAITTNCQEQDMNLENQDGENPDSLVRYSSKESKFESNTIQVIDYSSKSLKLQFPDLPEMQVFENGARFLKFGNSLQSATATQNAPNRNAPMSRLDWEQPPPFRYITALSQIVPMFELRSLKKTKSSSSSPESLLLIGLGSGSLVKYLRKLSPTSLKRIDIIEIDPIVLHIATHFFEFRDKFDANVTIGDVSDVLSSSAFKGRKYDLIIVDCASGSNNDGNKNNDINGVSGSIDTAQSASCTSTDLIRQLFENHLADPEVSIVAFNFLGFLHSGDEKKLESLSLTRFVQEKFVPFCGGNGVIVRARNGIEHKWDFDNFLVFGFSKKVDQQYVPKAYELVEQVEREWEERFKTISYEKDFLLQLIRGRILDDL